MKNVFEWVDKYKQNRVWFVLRQYFAGIKWLMPVYVRLGLAKPSSKRCLNSPFDCVDSMQPVVMRLSDGALNGFTQIADDWLDDEQNKPLLILWGFMPWKRAFISRYLPEYRVAFANEKASWKGQMKALDQLKDVCLCFWGSGEKNRVGEYAAKRRLKVLRIEDGFIRSVELGSLHTLPLSLAVDASGIYFDATAPSDIERLLLKFDFEANGQLVQSAALLRKIFCGLKISKYNLSGFQSAFSMLGPKIKKRVLILGQVEQDASIRYGLAAGWSSHKLIELAIDENPQAEILYKPHPDVIQGFRTNKEELVALQEKCDVLLEDLTLADLLAAVDHVYTMTSLSGMEALLHGCKVTVVGAPFYAGWGLTDDRVDLPRRGRKLSLDELFCGAYLLYPRYLASLDDPVVGCLAAILRVVGQRKQKLLSQITPKIVASRLEWIAESEYWPVLFRSEYLPGFSKKFGKKLISKLPVQKFFARCHGALFQKSLAYFLVGNLHSSDCYGALLTQLRGILQADIFESLAVDIWKMKPSEILMDQWAAHCESVNRFDEARELLDQLSFNLVSLPDRGSSLPIPTQRQGYVLKLAQMELRQRNLDEAERLFNLLLLSGNTSGDTFFGLADLARLKFDFASATELMAVFNHLSPVWKSGRGFLLQAQMAALSSAPWRALEALSCACLTNPQYVESVSGVADVLERILGPLPYAEAMQAAVEVMEDGSEISRAKGLIAHRRPSDAEKRLLSYMPATAETVKYCLMLSLAYSYQGKLEEAKKLIENLLPYHPTLLVYREGLRLAIVKNDYAWGKRLLDEAVARNLEVGDMYHRKIHLGVGDIRGSYLTFRNMRATNIIRAYAGLRYVQSLAELQTCNNAAMLAFFGPGDEIRFASLYQEFVRQLPGTRLRITCDPRIHPMLERGYPELEFVPVERVRSLTWLDDMSRFKDLPGSDLHTFVDNNGWALVQEVDRVILTTDALGDVIEGYHSFTGRSYLKADEAKANVWTARLQPYSTAPLIGLSWRSSLTTYSRNEHYLAVEELGPILAMEGVCFVNLQYDDCAAELAWIEQNYPGKMINFPDLDQYNDLDGVAALMCSLDLVIAPATTVIELAGALGRPAYLLSNSSELHWRKCPGGLMDVWHHSVHHIQGADVGDKSSLVLATRDAVAQFVRDIQMFEKK